MTYKRFFVVMFLSVPPMVHASSGAKPGFERYLPSYSQELSAHAQGVLADYIGDGEFYIRAAYIPLGANILNAPRVFYIFRSGEGIQRRKPEKKIYWRFKDNQDSFVTGSDLELLNACLFSAGKLIDEASLRAQLEIAVSAVLYEGRARLLKSEYALLSDYKLSIVRYVNSAQAKELRKYCNDPEWQSDKLSMQYTWSAYYITQLGGVEIVRVVVNGVFSRALSFEQKEVCPEGHFPPESMSSSGAETWIVKH